MALSVKQKKTYRGRYRSAIKKALKYLFQLEGNDIKAASNTDPLALPPVFNASQYLPGGSVGAVMLELENALVEKTSYVAR